MATCKALNHKRKSIMVTKFLSTSAVALATIFSLSQAGAADLDRVTDPTSIASESGPSWSGVYLGALGGYQFSNSALSYDEKCFENDVETYNASFGVNGLGADGLFGELQLGVDKQVTTRIVVGAFAGVNVNDSEFVVDASSQIIGNPSIGGDVLTFSQEWGGVLGARAGWLTTANTMLYVGGGWAFGEMNKIEFKGIEAAPDQDTDLSGYFLEIGMESRLAENVYFTVAGRYTDYGSITLAKGIDTEGCCDELHQNLELDHETLAVMAGLKVKLNTGSGLGF